MVRRAQGNTRAKSVLGPMNTPQPLRQLPERMCLDATVDATAQKNTEIKCVLCPISKDTLQGTLTPFINWNEN